MRAGGTVGLYSGSLEYSSLLNEKQKEKAFGDENVSATIQTFTK